MSTTHSVLWFGPENLVSYTRNGQLNKNVQRQHQLKISGNASRGEYNLEIRNVSRIDGGLYRCASVVNGQSVTADFMLKVLRKPSFSNNEFNFRLLSEVGTITKILLYGDAYPSPTFSWMSSSGGKLGRPVISQKNMNSVGQTWVLSVYFFTSSLPIEVKWYIDDQHIQQNNASTTSIQTANVTIICYEKNISIIGYKSDFFMEQDLDERHLKINCHIKNQYDSVEGSFENIWSAMRSVIRSTDMDFTETMVSTDSINRQSKENFIAVKDLYIYISISSATPLIIALSVAMIIVRIRMKRKGKLDLGVNAEREHARENSPPLAIQNESQYEEIDDISYNSVTWRNYDLDATPSLDESTDASASNSHIEIYKSIPNVYIELENSQPDTHHYQSTTLYEIPTNTTSENSLVKFKVIK
ncbi:Hypothetical predicted protein [Mytilus galloprovincialis]|uniref:Ig-like domain-containing protein n=1 Tax=Mytilus galloprovincialis TaxID=29158 RepID=A0A8B6G729_MYTGA|nr:Hypothetical predicted protein [Mytilus galloprovincialis]